MSCSIGFVSTRDDETLHKSIHVENERFTSKIDPFYFFFISVLLFAVLLVLLLLLLLKLLSGTADMMMIVFFSNFVPIFSCDCHRNLSTIFKDSSKLS